MDTAPPPVSGLQGQSLQMEVQPLILWCLQGPGTSGLLCGVWAVLW